MESSAATQRLDQFVDAAFAFAVTLLLIAGAQPPETLADLQTALLRIPASGAAFALIVLFWVHHRTFGRLTPARDGVSLLLSLAVVFTVLVYVFPLRLLTQSMFFWLSGGRLPGAGLIRSWGDLWWLYEVYGLGFGVLSGLYAALFARSAKLAGAGDARDRALSYRDAWTICAIAGLGSAGLAAVRPAAAPWAPPMIYWLIPITIQVRSVLRRRAEQRKAAAA